MSKCKHEWVPGHIYTDMEICRADACLATRTKREVTLERDLRWLLRQANGPAFGMVFTFSHEAKRIEVLRRKYLGGK